MVKSERKAPRQMKLSVLWRGKWIILLTTLAGLGAAIAEYAMTPYASGAAKRASSAIIRTGLGSCTMGQS